MVRIKSGPVELTEVRDNGGGTFEPGGARESADPDQEQAYYEFQASAQQEGGGYSLWVYQAPTDEQGNALAGKLERLFTAPIDRYKLDEILDRVATEYMEPTDRRWLVRIHIRKDGDPSIKRNMLFVVRRNLKRTEEETSHNILDAVGKMLADQQQRQTQMLREFMQQRTQPQIAAPTVDPMDQMVKMMTVMSAIQTPLLQALVGKAPAAPVDPMSQVSSMVTMMRSLKGLSDDLGGGGGGGGEGDGGGGALEIVKAVTPALGSLAQIIAASKIGSAASPGVSPSPVAPPVPFAPVSPPPTAPAVDPFKTLADTVPVLPDFPPQHTVPNPTAAPAGAAPPDMSEGEMILHLKSILDGLAKVATDGTGGDVSAMADQVMALIPENQDAAIFEKLSAPDWFETLSLLSPSIRPHKEWFTKLRDVILSRFEDTPAS